jgi:hypothetical protein
MKEKKRLNTEKAINKKCEDKAIGEQVRAAFASNNDCLYDFSLLTLKSALKHFSPSGVRRPSKKNDIIIELQRIFTSNAIMTTSNVPEVDIDDEECSANEYSSDDMSIDEGM